MSLKTFYSNIQRCSRSLFMHRLRSFLSTLGVLFGVVAVVTMLSIGEGAKQETLRQIQQLGMNNIIVRQALLSDDQLALAREKKSKGLVRDDGIFLVESIPPVVEQAPLKVVEASVTGTLADIAPEVLAVTDSYRDVKGLTVYQGRFICDHDINRKLPVCVLGWDVAQSLGPAGQVGKSLRLESQEFYIAGVLEEKRWSGGKGRGSNSNGGNSGNNSSNNAMSTRNHNKSIFIPMGSEATLPRKGGLKDGTLTELTLQVSPPQQLHAAAEAIKFLLARTHNGVEDYQIIIPQELLHQASRTQQTFNLVLGSIAAISLLVGGIGIMNIMLATVSERTREIGVRRAVGANSRHIAIQFMTETLLLTLTGAILGIAIGIVFSLLISYLAGWPTIVTAWSLLLSLAMAAGVGLFSGSYPAIKAASMDPIRALRHD